jgi:hypothetical protein
MSSSPDPVPHRFTTRAATPRSPAGSPAGDWCTPGRFALLLAGLICAAYPDVIFGGQVFCFRDFGFFGYPLAHYHRESFWRGEVPLWNPLSNCGLPFLAQWNTLVLYPGSLFYLLFPPVWALSFFCLFHLWLAGMGMYFLAWHWVRHRLGAAVAGLAFALNGLTLNSLMWPNNIAALGWMPWVVLLAERALNGGWRWWAMAAAVGAVQMLAGAPEIILFTWFITAGVATVRLWSAKPSCWRPAARFGCLGVTVAALAAAQLLPFLDLLHYSDRHPGFGGSSWAMPGTGWANLLLPLFYSIHGRHGVFFQYNQNWTSSYYLGIGVVGLALIGFLLHRNPRIWLLSGIALLGLVLAPGDQSFLYSGLHALVPQLGFMRFPIKFVVLTVFALPPLAAEGARCVFGSVVETRHTVPRVVLGVGMLLTFAVAGLLLFFVLQPPPWDGWNRTLWSGLSRAGFLWVILALLLSLGGSRRSVRASLLSWGILVATGLDALTHTPRQNPTVERVAFAPGAAQMAPRPTLGGSRAMMSTAAYKNYNSTVTSSPKNDYIAGRAGLFSNASLIEDIPEVGGFFSLYFPEQRRVWHALYNRQIPREVPPLLDFLGVSQITAPGKTLDFEWRPTAMPLVTAGQRPVFVDDEAAARAVCDGEFDPREVVLLSSGARRLVAVTNRTAARVLGSEFKARRVTLSVEATEPSLVVVSQTCAPRWRAYIDGRRALGLRANYAFVAVPVPAGRHVVSLSYRDTRFQVGILISLGASVLCVALLVRRTARRNPTTTR